jgi:hypothetical protein
MLEWFGTARLRPGATVPDGVTKKDDCQLEAHPGDCHLWKEAPTMRRLVVGCVWTCAADRAGGGGGGEREYGTRRSSTGRAPGVLNLSTILLLMISKQTLFPDGLRLPNFSLHTCRLLAYTTGQAAIIWALSMSLRTFPQLDRRQLLKGTGKRQ